MDKSLKEKIINVIKNNASDLESGKLSGNLFYLNPEVLDKIGFTAFTFAPLRVVLESDYGKEKHRITESDGRYADGLIVCYEDDKHSFDIAKFDKEANQWVLTDEMKEAGITTDDLPSISGIPTTEKTEPIQEEAKEESVKDDMKAKHIVDTDKENTKKTPGLLQQHVVTKREIVLDWLRNEENKENLAKGIFKNGCELHNIWIDTFNRSGDYLKSSDTDLVIEGSKVAHLKPHIGCWVLSDTFIGVKLTPEQLPQINGLPTITWQQYSYMYDYIRPQMQHPHGMHLYYGLPEHIMETLKEMDKHPTQEDIQKYCKVKGSNKSMVSGNENIPVSVDDLMACIFGEHVTRVPALEISEKETPNYDVVPSTNTQNDIKYNDNNNIEDR